MKNLIILIALSFSFSLTAQEDCKCGAVNYKVPGEMISKEVQENGWYTENYAGMIDDNVQFTAKHFIKDKDGNMVLNHIFIKTIPIKSIDWRFNDMFGSYSKYEDKTGADGKTRTELTLGVAFSGGGRPCQWIDDQCHTVVEGMDPNMKQVKNGTAIWTLFENKEQMVKFTDKVKAKQESMK